MRKPGLAPVKGDPRQDHDAVAALLGWYVNGTLDDAGRDRVQAHLAACDACAAAERLERTVARMMRETPSVELAPQAGLARIMQRIDRRESRRHWWSRPWRRWMGQGSLRPLVLAVSVQALVIVMLTAVLWAKLGPTAAPATFRTLSSPAPTDAVTGTALVRLVLADTTTLGELRGALAPWRSRIVMGPEARGIYTVAIDGDAAAALAALRGTPGVLLAEPVTGP